MSGGVSSHTDVGRGMNKEETMRKGCVQYRPCYTDEYDICETVGHDDPWDKETGCGTRHFIETSTVSGNRFQINAVLVDEVKELATVRGLKVDVMYLPVDPQSLSIDAEISVR